MSSRDLPSTARIASCASATRATATNIPSRPSVSFNRHYKERYSLVPDIIRPGLSFEAMVREALRRDLIDVPQAHREAWIGKRVAEHRSGANKLTDERNGRWVTITESRTESGHTVVIHTDLTELLRDLQNRLARAVFAWSGTLDKFTGDGLMATFGTPDPTGCDAANALSCARTIATDIAAFDAGRRAHGQPSLRAHPPRRRRRKTGRRAPVEVWTYCV